MCRVRTRSKREASSQNLTRKTSHMLNIPYNFLNGFELISKMTRGTSQSAEIRRLAEKSHVCSICIHRSIILIFIEKKKSMLVDFFSRQKYFSAIFDFHFCKNPSFRDEFQALIILGEQHRCSCPASTGGSCWSKTRTELITGSPLH